MTMTVPPTRLLPSCSPKWATRRRPERDSFGGELASVASKRAQPQRSAFTAQSGKDARDKWIDELFPLLRRSRALRPGAGLTARIYEGMGNEYIRFTNGSVIRLLSTSASSGHSKTLHQAVLDEIWHDADSRREQGLGPSMLTIADAQALMCST